LAVHRRITIPLPTLSREAELAAYRVVQECLTNVARHADATAVDLVVAADDGALTVCVSDDGRGMSAGSEGDGGGIRGMRERALLVGGRLEVGSRKPSGVTITLSVPIHQGHA
jgi:two-component system sensor histidine kinase UhpB